jgi:hypothetical protein
VIGPLDERHRDAQAVNRARPRAANTRARLTAGRRLDSHKTPFSRQNHRLLRFAIATAAGRRPTILVPLSGFVRLGSERTIEAVRYDCSFAKK